MTTRTELAKKRGIGTAFVCLMLGPVTGFGLPACRAALSQAPASQASSSPRAMVAALLAETNRVRAARGLRELTASDDLSAAAAAHAQDMLGRDYFAHVSPEGDSVAERMQKVSPRTIVLGLRENLFRTESSQNKPSEQRASIVIDGWMDSPGHRENLLSVESEQVGFGVATRMNRGRWVECTVQVLGIVAGRWDREPKSSIRTPARWQARMRVPIEFFIEDSLRPARRYPDPANKLRLWSGGVPLVVEASGETIAVEFPELDPGRYKILVRRKGDEPYQESRGVKVVE